MRKLLMVLPLLTMIGACSSDESLEDKGQHAGAAADKAIERAGDRVDAGQAKIESGAAKISDKALDVKQNVKEDLQKVDNAVDAAAVELKK